MLSKEEEVKLEWLNEIREAAKTHGGPPKLNYYEIEWLINKLKETNDELVQVHAELYKANKEFANYVEAHE